MEKFALLAIKFSCTIICSGDHWSTQKC